MAAVAGSEKGAAESVTITINDTEIEVPKGELIVESVKRLGLEIPIFCYHARMKPVGMCRMCLVEIGFKQPDGSVRKMPKPQAGCSLPADANMVVYTDTQMVHDDRRGVLEFLLINHPLDCPICDRGGECPLQNNTLFYGPSTSRFTELKRHLPKAFPLSDYVTLDLERCIQCGRCVRFTEEISGDSQLAFRFRGAQMVPSTFGMTDFESKFSGNTIEICPVGALTSAKYRFRARPWDIETRPAICTVCSNGCNIWFDHRVGKMMRINGRTNEAVNEEWTCDRGKFGHEFYNERRLTAPLKREGDALVECSWPDAYEAIIAAFSVGGNKVAALGGAQCSNEDVFLLQELFRSRFASNNLDHRYERILLSAEERLESTLGVNPIQDSIAALESKSAIFLFGTSLSDEEPILFLRVRKAWFQNGAKIIVAHDRPTDADSFAQLVLRYKAGTGSLLLAGLVRIAIESGGIKHAPHGLESKVSKFTPDYVAEITGIRSSDVVEAGLLLAGNLPACVATRNLLNEPNGKQTAEALAALSQVIEGSFNLYGLEANDQGCEDLGILPDMLPGRRTIPEAERGLGTHEILESCADRKLKALWLVNSDPIERHHNGALAEKALENVPFLVYQGPNETEAMKYASVVLPMAAPAESDGTFTNMERRVQRMRQVFAPKGDAKAAWRIFSEVMMRMKPGAPFFNPREVMEEIRMLVPWFDQGAYEHIEGEGRILEYNEKFNGNMAASVETFEKLNVTSMQETVSSYGAPGPHEPKDPIEL